jgi:drug/metabolite transporter (DMT)-like permease
MPPPPDLLTPGRPRPRAGSSFDPFYFAALRFGVAAAALSPFMLRALRHKKIMRAGVELGLITAAGYLTQSLGLLTTDASRASFLSTFTVLVVPILVGLSGRGVQPIIWAAAAASVGGVSLLEQSGAPPSVGDLWSVASAFAFGLQMFRTEHWSRRLSSKYTVHLMSVVLAVTAAAAAAAAAVAHPAALAHAVAAPGDFAAALSSDAVPWNAVLYTGLLSTDVALLMELVALRDVASSEAAIVYTLEPVLGAAIAFAVLGERWGPAGWAGAGIIVASSLVTQLCVTPEAPEGRGGVDIEGKES